MISGRARHWLPPGEMTAEIHEFDGQVEGWISDVALINHKKTLYISWMRKPASRPLAFSYVRMSTAQQLFGERQPRR